MLHRHPLAVLSTFVAFALLETNPRVLARRAPAEATA